MVVNQTKYGLKLKGKENLLQYNSRSLEGMDFAVDISYSLDTYGDGDWLVDNYQLALYVMFNSTTYYNADYDTPAHSYEPEGLEIVKVEIVRNEIPMDLKIVKITLKKEYKREIEIPYYNQEGFKDIMYMKNKVGYAIDNGDHYLIVDMDGVNSRSADYCKFSKEHFDIVE